MPQSLNRKYGYYWVRVTEDEDWEVAKYTLDRWFVSGYEIEFCDKELFEIDERMIVHE